jgi:hypothetical protein
MMVEERKRPRRGEVSYGDACGNVPSRIRMAESGAEEKGEKNSLDPGGSHGTAGKKQRGGLGK